MLYTAISSGTSAALPIRHVGHSFKVFAVAFSQYRPHRTLAGELSSLNNLLLATKRLALGVRSHNSRPTGRTAFSTSASVSQLGARTERTTTVIVGPLPLEMDDSRLSRVFLACGAIVHVRVRRDPKTGASLGYGYIKFASHQSVDRALELDGRVIDGQLVHVRSIVKHLDEVHVRGLSLDVTEEELKTLFKPWGEIIRVAIRSTTDGHSDRQVHGFVQFASPNSAKKALEASGMKLRGETIRVTQREPRSRSVITQAGHGETRPSKTVLTEGLPPQVNDEWLKTYFGNCGEVTYARVQRDFSTPGSSSTGNSLGYGYVVFSSPSSVVDALKLNNRSIDGHPLRIQRAPDPSFSPEVWSYLNPSDDDAVQPTASIWIHCLPRDVDDDRLRREFERFGKVVDAHTPKGLYALQNPGSGLGWVTFASQKSAHEAVKYNMKMTIDGFTVKIKRSKYASHRK
ncbi:RNA-binding domain-containing protein [Peniophora sp. CONT]|nr:RNA-binding domain-containing protein [Peniophora sp. CONT]